MSALDFWATDAWTDGRLPTFDEWSSTFRLHEWIRELTREETLRALGFQLSAETDWARK